MTLSSKLRALAGRRFRTVGPSEAATLVEGGALLLDVRERSEWNTGHAPAARHVPLGRVGSSMVGFPPDRTIVTVCRSGMRSAQAAKLLSRNGYDVVNLSGGMNAWTRAGLPVVGAKRGRR